MVSVSSAIVLLDALGASTELRKAVVDFIRSIMTRPIIALIANQLGPYQKPVLGFAQERLVQEGYGLLYVSGGPIKPQRDWDENRTVVRNQIYPLARTYDVSGYIIIASSIGNHAGPDKRAAFVEQFSHKPVVCLGPVTSRVPFVHLDDYGSMKILMEHMTSDASRQRFVFIRGYPEAPESILREQAFRDVLAQKKIPVIEDLIINGDFQPFPAFRAMNALLGQTRDIDAVVASNDAMAQSAVQALSNHGLQVPTDVIVSGFDDAICASTTLPPLTTVNHSMREGVSLAVDQLLMQIETGMTPQDAATSISVSTHLVVRASSDPSLIASYRSSERADAEIFDAESFSALLLDNINTIKTPPHLSSDDLVNEIVSMLVNGSIQEDSKLYAFLAQLHQYPQDVYWWRHLHVRMSDALKYQGNVGLSTAALGLVASILGEIHSRVWNVEATLQVSSMLFTESVYQIRALFAAASTMEEWSQALDVTAEIFPSSGGFVCVYEHPGAYPGERSRVIHTAPSADLVYHPEEYFSSREVLPNDFLHSRFKGPLVLEPLCAGATHLGYLVLDVASINYPSELNMSALADLIAGSLWRCLKHE